MMIALIFSILAIANAADVSRVNISSTSTVNNWITLSDLCYPAKPHCDGAWSCPNHLTAPQYHHKYGMICQDETVNEISLYDMCPFGGILTDDGFCTVYKQASSLGCPDLIEIVRTSSDILNCVYTYPVFCPKGHSYFNYAKKCLRFIPAICSNSTDCGKFVCNNDVEPHYYERYSPNVPLCIYKKYPAVANDAGYLECQEGEVLVEKYCVLYEVARYNDCSISATQTATPTYSSGLNNPSHSPYSTIEKPSGSPSPTCFKWVCDGEIQPTYTSIFETPICIYSRYDGVANSTGYLNCPNGGTLWDKICIIYGDAFIIPCETSSHTPYFTSRADIPSDSSSPSITSSTTPSLSNTPSISESSSITPYPTRVMPSVSSTPTPSSTQTNKIVEKPSETSTKTFMPSVSVTSTTPCDRYFCPDGMTPEYIYGVSIPVCVYRRYRAVSTADNKLYCPEGGQLVNGECILYEASVHMPCTMTSSPTIAEIPSVSPHPTRILQSFSSTPTPSSTQTNKIVEKPSETSTQTFMPSISATITAPCDRYFCPDGMTPEYIYGVSTPVCVYRRYRAVSTADNKLYCPEGGQLVNDECILYEESVHMPCTMTSSPTVAEIPSHSAYPTREFPSNSATPTITIKPVDVPTIIATITIEVRIDSLVNSTTDLSVFKNETVIESLVEAIAKALGVPKASVIIESLTWVENGNILSTIRLDNTTGRRRLQDTSNLDIKYKVVDAPRQLMELKQEDFATLVESSTVIQNVAVSFVSMATGTEVNQEAVVVQSREMMAKDVATSTNPTTESSNNVSNGVIGGIIGAVLMVVGVVGYYVIRSQRRNRDNNNLIRVMPVQDVVQHDNSTINPLRMSGMNSYYDSSRELPGMFPPQQARRSLV